MRWTDRWNLRRHLVHALSGWLAGAIAIVLCGFLGPLVFPGLVQASHYAYAIPSLTVVVAIILLVVSPLAMLAGLIGGALPREGGRNEQISVALFLGALIALPLGCVGLWYFSGG